LISIYRRLYGPRGGLNSEQKNWLEFGRRSWRISRYSLAGTEEKPIQDSLRIAVNTAEIQNGILLNIGMSLSQHERAYVLDRNRRLNVMKEKIFIFSVLIANTNVPSENLCLKSSFV
jgi:hypothetical protein